MQYID